MRMNLAREQRALPRRLGRATIYLFLAYWIVTALGVLLTIVFAVTLRPFSSVAMPMLQVPASPCSTTTTTAGSTSNGSTLEAMKGKEPPPRAMLFHNNRDGPFADVTSKAG